MARSESNPVLVGQADAEFVQQWRGRCDQQQQLRFEVRHSKAGGASADSAARRTGVVGGGTYELADHISFQHVDIVSPEGKLLVRDLNFTVEAGVNVMVTGPNGVGQSSRGARTRMAVGFMRGCRARVRSDDGFFCVNSFVSLALRALCFIMPLLLFVLFFSGKSSLFRVIGELWPLHCGVLQKPAKEDILFIPQKPYLVLGTLRDQIIYPHERADMERLGVTDEDLGRLLAIVDPARNITTEWQWSEADAETDADTRTHSDAAWRADVHTRLHALV